MIKKLFFKKTEIGNAVDNVQLVCDIIKEVRPELSKDHVLTPFTRFDEIGFDSMKYISFLLRVEELTKTDLEKIANSMDLSSIRTIDDMAKVIGSLR